MTSTSRTATAKTNRSAGASKRAAAARPRAASTAPRAASKRAPRRRGGAIRWDRVGRAALLIVLGVVVLLYIPPVTHWIEQRQTAGHQQAELEELQREHDELQGRLESLSGPRAIELEARSLGMVREGEQAIVIENLSAE